MPLNFHGSHRALLVPALFILFALAACGGTAPTPTPTPPTAAPLPTTAPTGTPLAVATVATSGVCQPGNLPSFVKTLVMAKNSSGANFDPIEPGDEFAPTQDKFHAVLTIENAPAGTKFKSTWYLLTSEGYKPNTKIQDTQVTTEGTRNVDFTLKSTSGDWPLGTYCVEIYANNDLALSHQFTVAGQGTSSASNSNPVITVKMAESVKPETFEPVNPTTSFKTKSPSIHATVQVKEAADSTKFQAKWYPPGQDPLTFDLETGGTRWLDFELTPGTDGYPAGDYKVEIYVNGDLAQTQTFTVQ